MGQKISISLFRAKQRMGNLFHQNGDITNVQRSVWFASGRSYSKLLHQDLELRSFIKQKVSNAGLVDVLIRRYFRKIELILYVTKPGIVIGKGGSSINQLKSDLISKFNLPKDLKLNIEEFKDPNRSAEIIAQEISQALAKNVPYRKLAKLYIEKIRYSGILGAKIVIKGRLNKAEIARKEEFAYGSIPRHTIDSVIDDALIHCKTSAGIIGVRVMLYKGDKIKNYTY
jgi:small subunit ribosomal protein S3